MKESLISRFFLHETLSIKFICLFCLVYFYICMLFLFKITIETDALQEIIFYFTFININDTNTN